MGKGLFEQVGQALTAREMLDLSLNEWISLVLLAFLIWIFQPIESTKRVLTWMAKYWLQDELRAFEEQKTFEEARSQARGRYEKDPGDGWVVAEFILALPFLEAETIYRRFELLEGTEKRHGSAPKYAFSCVLARHGRSQEARQLVEETDFIASFAETNEGSKKADMYYQEFFVKPGGVAALDRDDKGKSEMP